MGQRAYLWAGVVVAGLCLMGASGWAQEFELAPADHIAPQIRHDPPARAATAREPLTIDAIITDNLGVERVTLHYRALGATEYRELPMAPTVGDRYGTVIDAADVVDLGIEYYIQAEDAAGNSAMRGFAFSPLTVAVAPAEPAVVETGTVEGPKPWYKKPVVWAVVGGVAIAAAVASGGGGGGGGGSSGGGETILINGQTP